MPCAVQRREAAQRVADAAADCRGVDAVDRVLRTEGALTGWTVEILCDEPMPTTLHEVFEEHDFGVARAAPRGQQLHVVVA